MGLQGSVVEQLADELRAARVAQRLSLGTVSSLLRSIDLCSTAKRSSTGTSFSTDEFRAARLAQSLSLGTIARLFRSIDLYNRWKKE